MILLFNILILVLNSLTIYYYHYHILYVHVPNSVSLLSVKRGRGFQLMGTLYLQYPYIWQQENHRDHNNKGLVTPIISINNPITYIISPITYRINMDFMYIYK